MHDLLISPINLDARARAVLRIGVEAAAATSARACLTPLGGSLFEWLVATDRYQRYEYTPLHNSKEQFC